MYATSSKLFEFFDSVRERAALNLAECYLIAFGTSYDSEEALRWLQISKSYGNISSICLRRFSEVLGSPSPELVVKPKNQPKTSQNNEIEGYAASELYLMRKIQSRVVSAANQIRALSSEGHSWLHVNYIELQATTTLSRKIGSDIVGSDDMTTLEIAALLGEDEVIARLLSNGEAITGRKARIDALRCACIGGNLSSLKFLLDYGVDLSLCGKKDITALHLMIYMPVDLVQRAVSLLIAYGAPTNVCSKATRLAKTTFELVGTPIEWAVIARNRGLVAALLPHSKGQERNVLGHAISYAYYEIAEDLLSNGALSSGLVSEADCPILNYSQAFTHLFIHGRDGDIAIERTIRLCDAHNLINYNTMLRKCIAFARTQSCLKALEVLLDLCPPSIIRQGFESDVRDEVLMSNLYTALGQARANTAWKPVLEAILRNFSVAELDGVKELKKLESADIHTQENVLFTAVSAGWTTGVQVLLEKGVDRYQKINERTTFSIFDVAAQTGDIEMQAILSRYGEENENFLKKSMAHEYPSWWFSLHKDMAREKLNAFINKNPGNKDSSTRFVLSKAHEVLKQLLVFRDIYFSEHHVDAKSQNFEYSLWDAFLALISNESMAGYIDTPDEKDVTMLQRAASFLDLDVIRLLLEAGADANVPFLAKKRASDDGNDLVIPFLPFQIAIWVSRTSWLFARGTMGVAKTQDAIPSKQAVLEPTIKPQFLHRVAHVISHAAETGAKRIKGLTSGPTLTPGEKTAESLRNSSLRAAQELLQWHLLRNDRRFEGITEFHISSSMVYASHTISLARRNPKIADVKASWPGLEGKYTGQELAKMPWKDEWSVFSVDFRRLRGLRTRLA